MFIIERFLQSKYDNPDICEDGIFVNEHFVAVIDGVTPKGRLKWKGHTSGFYAKELILSGLDRLAGTETYFKAFTYLNLLLLREYSGQQKYFLQNAEERLQATVVIYSVYHRQVWCFGDCQFMINGRLFTNEMEIDRLLAEVRSVYLALEIMQGKSVEELLVSDPSQVIILPILKKQFMFSNKSCKYGFSVLDGFCKDFGNIIKHDVSEGSTLILASDGYPVLKQTLSESERALNEIRLKDPLCIKIYKSTRGFTDGKISPDDRAYIKFET